MLVEKSMHKNIATVLNTKFINNFSFNKIPKLFIYFFKLV